MQVKTTNYFGKEEILWDHLRSAKGSRPRFLQMQSRYASLIAPAIAKVALYWTILILLKDSLRRLSYVIST